MNHLLGIAVVGSDQAGTARALNRFHHAANANIDGLNRFHGGVEIPSVAYHIWICKINYH